MDSTLSVSKGCFVFKPERSKQHKRAGDVREAWYKSFKDCWQLVEDKIQGIHNTAFSDVLGHVVCYLKHCRADPVFADVVPAVALLTGVSVPDHAALFAAVCNELQNKVTPYIANLHGNDCRTVKATVEKLVSQFIRNGHDLDDTLTEFEVRKSKCTFTALSAWYKSVPATLEYGNAASPNANQFHPGSFEESGNSPINSPPPSVSKLSGNNDCVSIPCKSELSNEHGYFPGNLPARSPRNSAKKLKSPFKQLYTPTKSPRKLMIAKKLLLQSPDASKGNINIRHETSNFSKDRGKKVEKLNSSFSSYQNDELTSPSKSKVKFQASTRFCKVKTDLSSSFAAANSNSDVSSSEVQVSPSVQGSSPEDQVLTKKRSLTKSGSVPSLERSVYNSVVVLTPLKASLIVSPPSSSKFESETRRQSIKRPASASPCLSPEVKKRKAGQAVSPDRHSSASHKGAARKLASKPLLVVVVPDFESFVPSVLTDLILIASGYVQELPLVFVFGVATTIAAVHRSLPHHVSSKICIQVFQSSSSLDLLNQVVDKVLLCNDCPFMLSGRTFQLLQDIFLFYDFSVRSFVQRLKFCMLEHFMRGCAALCCPPSQLRDSIAVLRSDELDQLRNLTSFRRYVESRPRAEQAPLLVNDALFRRELEKLLHDLHKRVRLFHNALHCLHALTASLPKAPLGQNLRELYVVAVSSPVASSAQYEECRRLLELQSRDELESRLTAMSAALAGRELGDLTNKLPQWVEQLRMVAGRQLSPIKSPMKSPAKPNFGKHVNRSQLRQKISEMSRKVRPFSAYEALRKQIVMYLMEDTLPLYLVPLSSLPFNEVLLFDELSVKKHLVPSPRAALHTALNKPQHYLQCECCDLPEPTAILQTMPDICIAYKLHLESGRLVNLYDWLQAFVAIVCPGDGEETQEVDPHIQARFTQAVSELQFLGFIRASKKKTDHVMRTTWGTC